ncbi:MULTISPECIES: sensor histidine kinase [unclassified Variovorax]|uniref:sensor histidine kinase n=1 Tax=unclassified Variovorax TaxID=663243 RepID=UPI0008D7DA50|nr:Signal transduction histidine kinase [Variovorax sp. OK202]SFD35195.1 Signal transduction histidine kinase [Variovorax sp. OK212]
MHPSTPSSRSRPAPFFAKVVLLLSIALLCVIGIFFASMAHLQQPETLLHLTRADWQVDDASGFSVPPVRQDSDALPGRWQPIALPFAPPIALLRQAGSGAATRTTRTSWIRLSTRDLPAAAGPLALYGARIKTDGTIAVYINGQLVHRAQQQGPLWNSTRTPLWVELDHGTAGGAPPHEILLRLEHTQSAQVALSSLWIGPVESLRGRYGARQWLQQELPAMLSAAFMAVGVFALFVWFRRRDETGYLLFFNLAASSFMRGLHFYVSQPVANDWFAWLTVNALFWLVMVVHFFLRQLHGRELKWLTWGVVAATSVIGVVTMPVLAIVQNTPQVTPLIYAVAALMGTLVCLVGGVSAWRCSNEGRLVAVGIGICVLLGITDWLLQNNFISPEGWYLGAYTNAVTFSVFGALMYRRYVHAIGAVEQLNENLAQRLLKREAELEHSHQRLREIERLQTISAERQRLMQDMHDGLGSSLISAIRSVEGGGMSDDKVSQILKSCLDDLKLTLDSLEPIEADVLLLLATLRYRLEPRLEGTGVSLRWEVQELPALEWLDPSSALHILRIVQESISNILRHTRATEIRVATSMAGAGVQVTIEDNGQGFDVQRVTSDPSASGRGLQNQRRRAQAIRGTVNWESKPTGTRFVLWLPLQREAKAA